MDFFRYETDEFFDDALDQAGEGQVLAFTVVKQELAQLGSHLSVSFGFELVTSLLEYQSEFLVIGDNPIMNHGELVVDI